MGKKEKHHRAEKKEKKKKHRHAEKQQQPSAPQQHAEQEGRKQKKQKKREQREQREAAESRRSSSSSSSPASSSSSGGWSCWGGASPSSSSFSISSQDDDSDDDVQVTGTVSAPPPAAAAAAANGHAGRSAAEQQQQQQQQRQQQLAAKQAAAAAAVSTAQTVNEALRDEGFVLCEVAGAECDLDLSHINDPDRKELWVVRLPDGVSVDSLHGRHIHLPAALPDARHLKPPPNPFTEPGADLLTYVQAAVPAQNIGHMSLGADTATRTGNHRFRELLQEHEFEAMTFGVVAAAPPTPAQQQQQQGGRAGGASSSSSRLQLLKVGRFLHLASDNALVNKGRAAQVSAAGAGVWAAPDGWDGVLLPSSKPRRRLAGWQVIGGGEQQQRGSGGSDDDSSGDEEFEEEVFLSKAEVVALLRKQSARSLLQGGDGGAGADSDDGEQQQRSAKKQRRASAAAAAGGDGPDSSTLDPRGYSDLEDEPAAAVGAGRARLQLLASGGGVEDRALPGGGEPPFTSDLQQWVLCLPVIQRTAQLQQATSRAVPAAQWAADRAAWWQQPPQCQFLAPADADRQARLLQQLAAMRSGDGGEPAAATAAAAAAAGGGSSKAGTKWASEDARREYPCPLPLSQLATLPAEVESLLAGIKGDRARQRLRNAAVRLFVDWREVWVQVDKDVLDDDELWQLVHTMPSALRRSMHIALDKGRAARLKARQQAASVLGAQMVVAPPAPRPRYVATDAGYAPYQAIGEARVGGAAQNPGVGDEDARVAQWLVSKGAGERQRLVDAEELRNRGFEWDEDPAHLRREGLHVVLPDGRDVHIPAGTDLDWQGELQQVWGYDKLN